MFKLIINNKILIMKRYILLIVLITLTSGVEVSAQKKVLGSPEAFERPKVSERTGGINALYNRTDNKSRDTEWIVISDRDDNPVYQKASTSSTEVRRLQFRDIFYVVEEKGDWIRIATANSIKKLKSKSIQPVGWVKKENMLLWTSGLVDARTSINKKAFLLNRADDVNNVIERKIDLKELIVDFFRHPSKDLKEDERTIYDYYFILKEENKMVLLSEEAELTAFNISTKLLGWVSKRRLQEWNTRVSLEPNFDERAFDERKNGKNYQFKAFEDAISVEKFIKNGSTNKLFWDSDPVKLGTSDMAESNPRRFKGAVVRFPMFKKTEVGGIDIFRSGVIGSIKASKDGSGIRFESEIPEVEWSKIDQSISELDMRVNNVNIFFVIESTDKTYAFQQNIVQAINSLKYNDLIRKTKNVKYGALLYKDIPEGQNIIKYERLTSDLERVTNLVSQTNFGNVTDQDDYTAFYYGLKQSLKVAGFEDNATNIVILLGSNGDYSVNEARKRDAQSKGHESLITDKASIFRNLADKEIHMHGIQLYNDGSRSTGTAYAFQSYKFMLETAKFTYNKNLGSARFRRLTNDMSKNNFSYTTPYMEQPVGKTEVKIDGNKPGIIIRPMNGQSLNTSQISNSLSNIINESIEFEQVIKDAFDKIAKGGKLEPPKTNQSGSIITMPYQRAIIEKLDKIMDDAGEYDYVVDATQLKLQLYTEVYFPYQINGAKYPLANYVLFMPESDLVEYQNLMERCVNSAAKGTYPEKRKALYEIYISLIEQFAAQEYRDKRRAEDMTHQEVMKIMQGIEKEGLELDVNLNVRIGSIRNEREVPNEEIDRLIQRFNDVSAGLEFVLKRGKNYDFCFESDNNNRYYWLKLDQVF